MKAKVGLLLSLVLVALAMTGCLSTSPGATGNVDTELSATMGAYAKAIADKNEASMAGLFSYPAAVTVGEYAMVYDNAQHMRDTWLSGWEIFADDALTVEATRVTITHAQRVGDTASAVVILAIDVIEDDGMASMEYTETHVYQVKFRLVNGSWKITFISASLAHPGVA